MYQGWTCEDVCVERRRVKNTMVLCEQAINRSRVDTVSLQAAHLFIDCMEAIDLLNRLQLRIQVSDDYEAHPPYRRMPLRG